MELISSTNACPQTTEQVEKEKEMRNGGGRGGERVSTGLHACKHGSVQSF
jgi:hypothetical protein